MVTVLVIVSAPDSISFASSGAYGLRMYISISTYVFHESISSSSFVTLLQRASWHAEEHTELKSYNLVGSESVIPSNRIDSLLSHDEMMRVPPSPRVLIKEM